MNQNLTQERLKSCLNYDPATGVFTWIKKPNKRLPTGKPAGGLNQEGYHVIRVDGTLYKAHRLAWLYMHGAWPVAVVDHVNGDCADNRIENLRAVSQRVNSQNQRVAHKTNQLGILGVSATGCGSFSARIRVKGKLMGLGSYSTPQLAHAAYLQAKRALHAGCTI